jgi:hypothetical protein
MRQQVREVLSRWARLHGKNSATGFDVGSRLLVASFQADDQADDALKRGD